MKIKISKLNPLNLIIAIVMLVSSSIVFSPMPAHASGAAYFSLTPSSGSHTEGSTFTVTLSENSGSDSVNAVQANVGFNGTYLQYVSQSFGSSASSAFNFCSPNGNGLNGNLIEVGCAVADGNVSGNQVIEQITFKAQTNIGSGSIFMDSSSVISLPNGSGNDWNGSLANLGTYTVTAPVSGGGSSGGSSGGSTSGGSTGNSGGGSSGSTGSTSTGKSTSGGSSSPKGTTTNTSTNSNNNTATPSASTSTSPSAAVGTNTTNGVETNLSSTSSGYTIVIKVVNSSNKPVANATVVLNNRTEKTDDKGIASFTAEPGVYKVSVTGKGIKPYNKTLAVIPGQTSQQFTLAAHSNNILAVTLIIITLLLLIVLGIFGGPYAWKKRNSFMHGSSDSPVAVSGFEPVIGGVEPIVSNSASKPQNTSVNGPVIDPSVTPIDQDTEVITPDNPVVEQPSVNSENEVPKVIGSDPASKDSGSDSSDDIHIG